MRRTDAVIEGLAAQIVETPCVGAWILWKVHYMTGR